MSFLALAHHYAQRPIKAQAFAEFLGIPKTRVVNLGRALTEESSELLVETEPGVWRTAHDLLATEILEQTLTPADSDRRLWRQNLSSLSKSFAQFCRGSDSVPSEEMLELARRTFVYRDNVDPLGTERESKYFSQLIRDIPSKEGQLGVLKTLRDLYLEEAHFWAHLGRFYAYRMRDYERALECINVAIGLREHDHVLHHIRGMTLRRQIYELIGNRAPLDRLIELARSASASFQTARSLKPDDEHGYISEVQMLARVLDYAGRPYSNGVIGYLASPRAAPFLCDSFERAERLLEQVRRNREGEGASSYEEHCRAKMDALYGQHDKALQTFDNLLIREGIYKPPIRRQIVWTYLARKGRDWNAIDSQEASRIVELLERNLQEEEDDDKNLRLWVQAVRRLEHPPSIESVIERVGYWRVNSGSLDSVYYLYVFYAILALDGSSLARNEAIRYLNECRHLARFRRNRTRSLEWFGTGYGVDQLVHHSELGKWIHGKDFWEKTSRLVRVTGRISRVSAPQAGEIEVEGGLSAFYVPARGGGFSQDRRNQRVEFYLGFSYDGLRAWEVDDL
jgi:tetratricopeptide (TPR) repeat protein